jgi:RHS repeat-associated protein
MLMAYRMLISGGSPASLQTLPGNTRALPSAPNTSGDGPGSGLQSGSFTVVSDQRLVHHGWSLIAERPITSTGAWTRYYHGPGTDNLLAAQPAATGLVHHFHGDALNSTGALTNAAGAVIERARYSPFGLPEVLNAAGTAVLAQSTVGNRFLFQGREWLGEVRLNDHRNRLYSADLQRWINRDPIGERGGVNLYDFVDNRTTVIADPTGLYPEGSDPAKGNWVFECERRCADAYKKEVEKAYKTHRMEMAVAVGVYATALAVCAFSGPGYGICAASASIALGFASALSLGYLVLNIESAKTTYDECMKNCNTVCPVEGTTKGTLGPNFFPDGSPILL